MLSTAGKSPKMICAQSAMTRLTAPPSTTWRGARTAAARMCTASAWRNGCTTRRAPIGCAAAAWEPTFETAVVFLCMSLTGCSLHLIWVHSCLPNHKLCRARMQEVQCPWCRSPWGAFTWRAPRRLTRRPKRDTASIHHDTYCHTCAATPIVGSRYMCCTCTRVSLCQTCFHAGCHPEHRFLHFSTATARGEHASRDLMAPVCLSLLTSGGTSARPGGWDLAVAGGTSVFAEALGRRGQLLHSRRGRGQRCPQGPLAESVLPSVCRTVQGDAHWQGEGAIVEAASTPFPSIVAGTLRGQQGQSAAAEAALTCPGGSGPLNVGQSAQPGRCSTGVVSVATQGGPASACHASPLGGAATLASPFSEQKVIGRSVKPSSADGGRRFGSHEPQATASTGRGSKIGLESGRVELGEAIEASHHHRMCIGSARCLGRGMRSCSNLGDVGTCRAQQGGMEVLQIGVHGTRAALHSQSLTSSIAAACLETSHPLALPSQCQLRQRTLAVLEEVPSAAELESDAGSLSSRFLQSRSQVATLRAAARSAHQAVMKTETPLPPLAGRWHSIPGGSIPSTNAALRLQADHFYGTAIHTCAMHEKVSGWPGAHHTRGGLEVCCTGDLSKHCAGHHSNAALGIAGHAGVRGVPCCTAQEWSTPGCQLGGKLDVQHSVLDKQNGTPWQRSASSWEHRRCSPQLYAQRLERFSSGGNLPATLPPLGHCPVTPRRTSPCQEPVGNQTQEQLVDIDHNVDVHFAKSVFGQEQRTVQAKPLNAHGPSDWTPDVTGTGERTQHVYTETLVVLDGDCPRAWNVHEPHRHMVHNPLFDTPAAPSD
jgi:hypothetical protein